MSLTWAQALAWRMRRQLLDPVGAAPVAAVVDRLAAVPAFPDHSAELAVRLRRAGSRPGDVARALAAGEIIKSYAFRGATHLLTPEDGGAFLALRAAGRMWELPSWQSHYGLSPADWPRLRQTVRAALAVGPLTRDELRAAMTAPRGFGQLASAFDGSDTLLKPLTWLGDMSFGPPRGGQATFQLLDTNPRWAGLPDLDTAGPRAIALYLRSYGPATARHVQYWLGEGLGAGRRRIASWLADGLATDLLAEVDVAGESALVLRADLEDLAAATPTDALRLLPGHDQWVLGPGTADPHVVPPARRRAVTNKANLVIAAGVVSGTWRVVGADLVIAWFAEAGPVPDQRLTAEAERLADILGKPLRPRVEAG
ncbi:crosslink repair DNA glycosylase YcaQ family protein [Asanoa sp. WMMD1127]|uniref:DNA glycosylase AlkZ-like family protein n=1 Tax=Asanoa sp. WMMD1127 TaxID=3016107 RepID=UPI002416495D|nr:crosslink repair DNA glycosylase YcaQ family protein [Asanoa sp. WMMD1127]MDG4825386.1 crosslink repair DNA glycosylase YcaQ family protein [Asanoa sp. WMMD1127]